MTPRDIASCLACLTLAITGLIVGLKFLRRGNVLLGVEALIVGFSASNFLLFFLTASPTAYAISHFCDAFSRGFGIPIVAVAGLMVATHGYRPSLLHDVLLLGGSAAATAFVISVPVMAGPLPYFYVVMWALFTAYLCSVVLLLVRSGHSVRGAGLTIAMLASLVVALIYDFYKIPGDEQNVLLNFFVIALLTWSYLLVELYRGYIALTPTKTPASR